MEWALLTDCLRKLHQTYWGKCLIWCVGTRTSRHAVQAWQPSEISSLYLWKISQVNTMPRVLCAKQFHLDQLHSTLYSSLTPSSELHIRTVIRSHVLTSNKWWEWLNVVGWLPTELATRLAPKPPCTSATVMSVASRWTLNVEGRLFLIPSSPFLLSSQVQPAAAMAAYTHWN